MKSPPNDQHFPPNAARGWRRRRGAIAGEKLCSGGGDCLGDSGARVAPHPSVQHFLGQPSLLGGRREARTCAVRRRSMDHLKHRYAPHDSTSACLKKASADLP